MITLRLAMLAGSMMLMLAALGVTSERWQPSALRLVVTAVVGLLAPLFWPGCGATAARNIDCNTDRNTACTTARTGARIVGWSAAAAALAAASLLILGGPRQTLMRAVAACAVLLLMLVPVHTLVAALELRWRRRSVAAQDAREQASRMAVLALALLGALPLWCGPVAQLLATRQPWLVDTAVGISPLTHLAVASSNDLLRNEWFYQHSNLASVQVSYPPLAWVAGSYGAVCAALAILALACRRRQLRIDDTTRSFSLQEKIQP